MDGPVRASRAAAEKDRELVAAIMSMRHGSSKIEVASAAIKCLRNGKVPTLEDAPGPASAICNIGTDEFANMGMAQLRKLANQTPGITKHKKKEGKRSTKSNKELKEDLLAQLRKATSVQALATAPVSGSAKSCRAKKRPASMKNAPRVRKTSKLQC